MKKISFTIVILLINLLVQKPTMANAIRQKTIENDSQDLSLPLSPNKIAVQIQNEQVQRDRINRPQSMIEVGVSSWLPSKLQTPSRLENTSSYSSTGVPAININLIQPLAASLNLKLGAGLVLMHRFADFSVASQNMREEETASVVFSRFGMEFKPEIISTPIIQPYFSGSIIATMVLTNRTALDSGNSYFGLPVDLGVGTIVQITKALGVKLGVCETLGSINSSSVSGAGAEIMARFQL